MKKLISVIAAVASLALLAGCKTTETAHSNYGLGSKSKANGKSYKIVNSAGATFDRPVPAWVLLLVDGQYSQEVLSEAMPNLEGKKVFVVSDRGDNLDFVKRWVNLVDIETEVGGTLERVTGKVVTAKFEGDSAAKGDSATPSNTSKAVEDFRIAVQDVRIVGLEKVADYWVQIEVTEKKEVVDSYYEYYSVWAMDKSLFKKQVSKSMEKIDEATTETANLKALVLDRLTNELSLASENEDMVETADKISVGNYEDYDEYVVYGK